MWESIRLRSTHVSKGRFPFANQKSKTNLISDRLVYAGHSMLGFVQKCHPHSIETLMCPQSPQLVTHCPCGRTPLSELSAKPRASCASPIPTCPLKCDRPRAECEHPCGLPCHEGECKLCEVIVTVPCRCGSSNVKMMCFEKQLREEQGEEVLCERICPALRR